MGPGRVACEEGLWPWGFALSGGAGRPRVPRAGWKVEKGLGPKGGGVCPPGPGNSEQDGGLGSAVEQNASWT